MNNHFDEDLSGEMSCDEEGNVNKVPKQRSFIIRLFGFSSLVVGSVVSSLPNPFFYLFLIKFLLDRILGPFISFLSLLGGEKPDVFQPIPWKHPFNPFSWSKTFRRVIGAIILIPSILLLILGIILSITGR